LCGVIKALRWHPNGNQLAHLLRFSDYDLFGYLAAGMIVFGPCDFVFGTQIVLKDFWFAVVVILGDYVASHIGPGGVSS